MKRATTTLMLLSLAVCIATAGVLLWRQADVRDSADAFASLAQELNVLSSAKAEETLVEDPGGNTAAIHGNPLVDGLPPTEDPILLAYREKAKEQPDFVGWLQIAGTPIDYPVMRSPEESERYLHRDFDGGYSRAGTPFMMPVSDPSVPNENIIIYAHHMKDGSMFGSLPVYETVEGYEQQPEFQFNTLYERGTYRIIAVFRTSVGAPDEFHYYNYEWLDDEETFDEYLSGVMANRLYDTGETAVYGDRLLTLSTCDYHESNGRLVVVAKRIEQMEESGDE